MLTLFHGLIHTRLWTTNGRLPEILIYPVPCGFIQIHEILIIIPCSQKYLPYSVASYTSMNNVGEVPRNAYPVLWLHTRP